MARDRLGEILIKAGLLDEESLDSALQEQKRWGGHLGTYLVQLDLISEETLVRALSTQYKLPAVALDPPRLNHDVAKLVPRDICERNRLICFRVDKEKRFLDVAMADPASLEAVDDVRVATRFNVRPFFAPPSAIDTAINIVFYGGSGAGGMIDLSPGSDLRTESELLTRARGAQAPSYKQDPRGGGIAGILNEPVLDLDEAPELKVEVTASSAKGHQPTPPPVPPPAPPAKPVKSKTRQITDTIDRIPLPEPTGDEEGFHITMDVPALEKEELDDPAARLDRLEAIIMRDSALLQLLLSALVRKGIFTRDEVDVILRRL